MEQFLNILPQYSHVSFRPDLGCPGVLLFPLPLFPPSDFGPDPDPDPLPNPARLPSVGGVPVIDPFAGEDSDIGDGGVPDPVPLPRFAPSPIPIDGPGGQGDDEVEYGPWCDPREPESGGGG